MAVSQNLQLNSETYQISNKEGTPQRTVVSKNILQSGVK